MLWPIYIPSRGRPSAKLIRELSGLATVVVEPQELEEYAAASPDVRFLILPAGNQGIAYVRNFILNHARQTKQSWFWMLDDDIRAFHLNGDGKPQKIAVDIALAYAEGIITAHKNVGQAAIEYQQFAWAAKRRFVLNSYCDVCVAINTQLTRTLRYRQEVNLKEDRDFTLQVLAKGACTMRVQKVGFRAPPNGSNKGGLHDAYGREGAAVDKMAEMWPGIVTKQVKKNGRIDCKIDWRFFK